MLLQKDGATVHIWSGTDAAPGVYIGSVPVHPNESPPDSDTLLGRLGVRATHFEYDFDDDGGSITGAAASTFISDKIPAGARVLGGFYKVDTTATSAVDGGTGSLGIEAAGDLLTAAAISTGTTFDAASAVDLLLATNDTVLLTEDRQVIFRRAVEAWTAGKFWGLVFWTMSPEVTGVATT